ncbi:porin family protein [Pseudomonas sp. OIL-1]|uniref:porin family protein n=1 Tax=Pseudomonas sp. OIL-1 TaxID=2706126 RepID=UPI0013A7268E|nr:porin family protein [Pseudomonas sp. OIL-1]QIB50776.1 porin family protein [Pseudomonas sp. OIL-1]
MLKKTLLAALVSGVMISGVQAAEIQPNGYLFGNVGQSEVDLDALSDAGLSTDDNSSAFKVGAGIQLNRYLGIEFQYVDLGEFTAKTGSAKAEITSTGLGANLVATLPVDRFKLYGKVGYHKMETEGRIIFAGSTVLSEDEDENIQSFAVGASFALMPELEVLAEYERYKDMSEDLTESEEDVDFISIGLRYNF